MTEPVPGRIVFLVTEDWYFCSHRLPMARAARDMGLEVVVATRVREHGDAIVREGFRLVPLRLDRRGRNPLSELAAVAEIIGVYRAERPDIVHHVALKPILYGTIAAVVARVPRVVNAFAGMGYVFIARTLRARMLSRLLLAVLRLLMRGRGRYLVVQNGDDRAMALAARLVPEARIALIPGSGVDTGAFVPTAEPAGTPVAAYVGRMLWDKGVGELVEAARQLHRDGVPIKVVLAGSPDPANPRSIPEERLWRWYEEGVVQWLGHRDDVSAVWAGAHIAVLPSYREGLPKSLLEAGACGRPLVATDVPGCREVVIEGETGLRVPARDAVALAAALARLAESADLRARLGAGARRLVEERFADSAVRASVIALYRELLGGGRA
jgi:glycosyltransferase involved in cell wall biosynthesis